MRPIDTSPDAYRRQIDAYRAMTASHRLWLAAGLSDDVRRLADAGSGRRDAERRPESSIPPRDDSRR